MKKLSLVILVILIAFTSKLVLSFVDIIFISVVIALCYYAFQFIKIEAIKIYKKY